MLWVRIFLSVLLLIPVAFAKIGLVLVGLLIVPVTSDSRGLYRAGPGRPKTYWERAIRNPVGGFNYLISHPPAEEILTYGSVTEPTPEGPRFQWRFRQAWEPLCSMRIVWRYSRKNYGELYLGWKLLSAPPELDFALSLRPWATIGN